MALANILSSLLRAKGPTQLVVVPQYQGPSGLENAVVKTFSDMWVVVDFWMHLFI